MREYEKSCVKCLARFHKRTVVCKRCGGALLTVDISPAQIRKRFLRRIFIAGSAFCIPVLVFVALFAWFDSSDGKTQAEGKPSAVDSHAASTPPKSDEGQGQASRFAVASITPWQFIKNPYMDSGQLVRLDYRKIALISNGSLITYRRCTSTPTACNQFGLISLQFNRMFAAHQALYNVIANNADSNGQGEKQGELLVDIASSDEAPALDADWIVMPEEPTSGTNGYGAHISVPTVRFIRYAMDGDSPRTS